MTAHALLLVAASLAAPPADLDQLSWLAGHWLAEDGATRVEEVWLAPHGGVMAGINRSSDGHKASIETLRILQRGPGLVYVAAPEGQPAVEFSATAVQSRSVRFENPDHDFPRYVEYTLRDANALEACVGADSTQRCWQWTRVGAPQAAAPQPAGEEER